jgi:UDPglucose--hexose-1-phosphate uridylyltransferase
MRSILTPPEGVHRRYNPLTREWVLVSPQRMKRPWQGQTEPDAVQVRPAYDPQCYLCPGNERAGGQRNPAYEATFVFENDFPALLPDRESAAGVQRRQSPLMVSHPERGRCRVLCYAPQHNLGLVNLPTASIRRVVDVWAQEFAALGEMPHIGYVQVFENRGEMMGASSPHPHGQIWANESIPNEPLKEDRAQREYRAEAGRCLLCDYLALELIDRDRLVVQNDGFIAMVPFWAVWPFETLLISKGHAPSLDRLDYVERDALAEILKSLITAYDNLFGVPFPYSMGFHQQPTDGQPHPEWHLHAHFYPPLLQSATVRKFLVGYEMLAQPQRDLTAEEAASHLRKASEREPG